MNDLNFTLSFVVDQTPDEVFNAINNVRAWWAGRIEGETDRLGAQFRYRYADLHNSLQRITELVPGRRVAWHVDEGYLSFVDRTDEWTGTDIVFDIVPLPGMTEVRFTHVGLAPQRECFDSCSDGWTRFIMGSLRRYITTGQVQPTPFEMAA